MLPFLNNIDNNPHFQLEQLVIGWSQEEMGFMAALGFDIGSLPQLLSDIGFDLPEDHGLDKNHVEIVLAYERVKSKNEKGEIVAQGYATYAKITIAGPLRLSDIIDTGGFPGLPQLDKVELVFEIDKQSTKDQSAKDALIGFRMYFSTEGRPDTDTTIIEVLYEKETKSGTPALSAPPAAPNEDQAVTINKKFRAVMYSPDGGDSVQLDFKPYVPIELNVKDMFILQTSRMNLENPSAKGTITEETTLFGLDLDMQVHLDLSKLPLIGKDLADTQLSFEAFRVLYSHKEVKAKGLPVINGLLEAMYVPPVVAQQSTGDNKTPENSIGLKKGFNFQGTIILGDEKIELFSGSKGNDSQKDPDKVLAANEDPTAKDVAQSETPAPVGKKYGPITVHNMSMALKKGFHLDLTASLELGPLELDLIGFSMEFPIQKLLPKPPAQDNTPDDDGLKMSIQGMNIAYHKPPLTIDGGFMKQADESQGVTYSGALSIGLKAFQLTAFGSFGEATQDGDKYKTFFVYGFLATPPLGPPILQLTGVALGFGYNRQVELPAPENIDIHPLVESVVNGDVPDFGKMNGKISPSKGDYWAALGVRIESFKMINTFVLAIFKFGHEFEIDLLGRVSLVLPQNPSGSAAIPPLAKLNIGIVATILPERGVVEIHGRVLPGSYIFEPSAVLSGGFAFLVIAKDQTEGKWNGGKAGDFVVSFGGYNPNYTPKPYYPQAIPRMALTWTPYQNLSVAADMYFTVVPEAFMFGGHLSVNFNAGGKFSIFVHFEAGLDFIVWWQPKRYIGHAYANLQVGATVWFVTWQKVEFDLSGDLTFWGPPFAGHASFKVHVLVTFTVDVDFGPAQTAPRPIDWRTFKQTLLPETEKVLSTALTNGLLGKLEIGEDTNSKENIYLVNPKDFELDIASAFPVKQINGDAAGIKQEFGIAPMAAKDFGSDLRVSITRDGRPIDKIEAHFTLEKTSKNYPAAAWQQVALPGVIPAPPPQDKNLLELCGGLVLKGKAPKNGQPFSIPSQQFDIIAVPPVSWELEEFTYAA
ncbi:MAG TPA: hypothetical protein PKA00_19045 [Saprospiraceae bacterium]|nr:hypothetical protein [Saprospiraceae bacterium]HMQ85016.1 hypothetical protein [Saprospiraceae bacterium]